jgi:hypothetical protein
MSQQQTTDVVTKVALDLSDVLFEKQVEMFNERYMLGQETTQTTHRHVDGMPTLLYSDLFPHRPLFVSSVKMDYVVDAATLVMTAANTIKISVEFQVEKSVTL